MDRRTLIKTLAAAPAMQFGAARAQGAWPQRAINIVVGFPPGGQADFAARPVAAALQKALGQAVIVENKAGAGGKIAHAFVAQAEPDGYTLLCTLPSLAVLPEADRLFDRKVGYEVGDLMPIARILADPSLLVVRADAPWKTAQDYIAALKAAPRDSIPYGSSGAYGTLHIAMEMFAVESGLRPLHVPFTGAGPALNALLAGDVKAIPATPGVIKGQLEAKAVRVLASWGAERVPAFKDVPTFKELGFPGIEYYNWAGLFGPKTLPAPIVDRLRAEMKAVMADPSVIKVFEAADSPPAWLDKPDFEKFVAADTVRLVAATKKVGRVE